MYSNYIISYEMRDTVEEETKKSEIDFEPILKSIMNRETNKVQGIEPLQIAPSHGIIWKQDLTKILAAYRAWANGEVKEKVLVIYDTMWGSTEIMANEIAEAVRAAGVEV